MVVLLVLGWLMLAWWVPASSFALWLSAGFGLFTLVLVVPSVSRQWYWLPVGGLAGLGLLLAMPPGV
ncbi:hypothetical protein LL240_10975 [Oceanimonas baumannii]|uniref:hypothetical protein n=1 Tax=Oceanimonas baumannii TaxID=129578 RepID=UPI001D18C417|nr:hypothetical protein [Oceanimonas baumannii]MCC4264972.1 hypothetical protein [Oceanimonas baumannii]